MEKESQLSKKKKQHKIINFLPFKLRLKVIIHNFFVTENATESRQEIGSRKSLAHPSRISAGESGKALMIDVLNVPSFKRLQREMLLCILIFTSGVSIIRLDFTFLTSHSILHIAG